MKAKLYLSHKRLEKAIIRFAFNALNPINNIGADTKRMIVMFTPCEIRITIHYSLQLFPLR
ncbi:hypothetical protein BCV08_11340 [Vibrio breoganii]|nr:hypothetical protein BCV08_11340 [Vibrio breoganii]PML12509.1 hypothetical protein BCT84_15270 [Vibrio breoganii]